MAKRRVLSLGEVFRHGRQSFYSSGENFLKFMQEFITEKTISGEHLAAVN